MHMFYLFKSVFIYFAPKKDDVVLPYSGAAKTTGGCIILDISISEFWQLVFGLCACNKL